MINDDQLVDLLVRWEELREQGRELPAEELGGDCPELVAELKRRIHALQQAEGVFDVNRWRIDQAAARPSEPLPTVAGYEIVAELGRGGMGVVYKARQIDLRRLVALKMIRGDGPDRPEERVRFRTEAEAVARLQHAHIVQIHEIGEQAGRPYLSLEFVDGGSLAQQLAGRPLPARQAATLIQTLARAMQVAHQRGIVHRDLKPANILVTADGVPKISDFGLAKRLDEDLGQTRTGAIMGTPSYMAPEQASGQVHDIGPLADVYALGAILYELLTGRPPFRGATTLDTLEQVRTAEAVPPRRLQPKVPRELETICLKCLRKEPAKRYATAAALAEDLSRFLAGRPIQARRAGLVERTRKWARRRPTAAALVGVCLLSVLGVIAGGVWYGQRLQALQASALVQTLVSAEIGSVPRIVEELAPYRRWADPLLAQTTAEAKADSKERLHAALALVQTDPGQVDYLYERLLQARPDELATIRDALANYRHDLTERLWALLEDTKALEAQRFCAGLALATYAPADAEEISARWRRMAPFLVKQLLATVARNPGYYAPLVQALHPVRGSLCDPLTAIFHDSQRPELERSLAASMLAEYVAGQPKVLADLLLDADDKQFAILYPKLQQHGERGASLMLAELAQQPQPRWSDPPIDPAWNEPDLSWVKKIEAAHGLCAERFAFCQTMPLSEFLSVAEGLRSSGYRPIRFRPFVHDQSVRVAAAWTRDGQDWQLAHGLSAEEIRKRDAEQRKQAYEPLDVMGYLDGDKERYAVLWEKTAKQATARLLDVGMDPIQFDAKKTRLRQDGFCRAVLSVLSGRNGEEHVSAIWVEAPDRAQTSDKAYFQWEAAEYTGQEMPDLLQVDVHVSKRKQPARTQGGDAGPRRVAGKARRYVAVWHPSTKLVSVEVHGLDPVGHLARCRALMAQGYRLASLTVAEVGAGESLVAASVWHRPVVMPEGEKERPLSRQANAAVALLKMGQPERVWPLLQHGPDPSVRTCLIHRLGPMGAAPQALVQRLESEPLVSVRRALVLSLGGFPEDALPVSRRRPWLEKLLQAYRDDPDPGLHSALDWLLRRWGQEERVNTIDQELVTSRPSGQRQWYVNSQGQTLAVIPGPVEFEMGAPRYEADPNLAEIPRRVRIRRSFAIATKEVTVAQFYRFWRTASSNGHFYGFRGGRNYSPNQDGPILNVTWFEAARYCRWLSEQEGIPEGQMCYPPVGQIKEGMQLPPDYLTRTGYRLPTEAEWEYACRAGAATARSYGFSEKMLKYYAWYPGNADDRAWPVGQLKPNDLGLFDMYGNASEWCQEQPLSYPNEAEGRVFDDCEELDPVTDAMPRVLRGGAFNSRMTNLRSAERFQSVPNDRNQMVGLRVARTIVSQARQVTLPGDGPPPGPIATAITITAPAAMNKGERRMRAVVRVTASDGSVPSGTVTLTFGNFGTFTHTLENGETVYTLFSLPPGTYQLQANYPARGEYAGSQSISQQLQVR